MVDTVEEALVLREARNTLRKAKEYLKSFDPDVVEYNLAKQIISVITHAKEKLILEMLTKGVIRQCDAEILFREAHEFKIEYRRKWLSKIWKAESISSNS